MTRGARARIMIRRFAVRVTRLAIRRRACCGVIKFNVLPIRGVLMTIGAHALIVIRRFTTDVARRAVNTAD